MSRKAPCGGLSGFKRPITELRQPARNHLPASEYPPVKRPRPSETPSVGRLAGLTRADRERTAACGRRPPKILRPARDSGFRNRL